MNINQRAAFAAVAIEEDRLAREKSKSRAKKPKRQGSKKMNPVSRKGKSKFRY